MFDKILLSTKQLKGAIIRSRAMSICYEHGEQNSKYFINLEQRSHKNEHVIKLKSSQNEYVEEPKFTQDRKFI